MKTFAALTVTLLIAVPCALAGESPADSAGAARAQTDAIAPFVDPLTVLIVRVDIAKIDSDAVIKQIEEWQKVAIKDPKELRESVADTKKDLQVAKKLLRDFRDAGAFTEVFAKAREAGFAESGYRTVLNCNRGAGQTVFHLHLHVIGGGRFHLSGG